uniref:D-glutamate cyclase-like C-terminal domain-containing protein n=1 Tax=Ciona savignyi TaxID=51511 RepID=H2Y4B7_CIOSA
DMVTFYFGCSFSFNQILLENKMLTPNARNVSMYRTNIDCYSCGEFQCKMMVSMRAISKDHLSKLHEITAKLPDVHGAPIHYGNSGKFQTICKIGISDLQDYMGESTEFGENDVPVFWCCGITGIESLTTAKIDRCFTHSPGSMFITDVLQEKAEISTDPKDMCEVVEYSKNLYSAVSKHTIEKMEAIYNIVKSDPGKRGIKNLIAEGGFVKATLALSHANKVAIVTGAPVHLTHQQLDETDGLPGVISLAVALQSLGKTVDVLADEYSIAATRNIIAKCLKLGIIKNNLNVVPTRKFEMFTADKNPNYDVFLATERLGQAKDGHFYSMLAKDLSQYIDPVDDTFMQSTNHPDVVTIAIGDGGNELGMGNALENVVKYIPNGKKIACVISSNNLIAAGVSNWGCYGLALSLYLAMSCPVHERYVRRAVGFPVDVAAMMKNALPSVEREREILNVTEEFGFRDGRSPDTLMSVDGLLFDKEHQQVIRGMLNIVGKQ